jgi:hypothetical protein
MTSEQFVHWLKGFLEADNLIFKTTKDKILSQLDKIESPKPFNPDWFKYVEYDHTIPDKVPYGSICSCNPSKGGSGICGCVMANTLVPNPEKYGYTETKTSTTTNFDTKELLNG